MIRFIVDVYLLLESQGRCVVVLERCAVQTEQRQEQDRYAPFHFYTSRLVLRAEIDLEWL